MLSDHADVVVVGAGIVGLSAARALAGAGARVRGGGARAGRGPRPPPRPPGGSPPRPRRRRARRCSTWPCAARERHRAAGRGASETRPASTCELSRAGTLEVAFTDEEERALARRREWQRARGLAVESLGAGRGPAGRAEREPRGARRAPVPRGPVGGQRPPDAGAGGVGRRARRGAAFRPAGHRPRRGERGRVAGVKTGTETLSRAGGDRGHGRLVGGARPGTPSRRRWSRCAGRSSPSTRLPGPCATSVLGPRATSCRAPAAACWRAARWSARASTRRSPRRACAPSVRSRRDRAACWRTSPVGGFVGGAAPGHARRPAHRGSRRRARPLPRHGPLSERDPARSARRRGGGPPRAGPARANRPGSVLPGAFLAAGLEARAHLLLGTITSRVTEVEFPDPSVAV